MAERDVAVDETLDAVRAEVRELRSLLTRLGRETVGSTLDAWRARIDNLWVQADLARMEGRDEVRASIEEADRVWQTTRERLAIVSDEAGDVGGALVEGLRAARSDLGAAVELAEERIEAGRD
jgi:hypothetical protein